MLPDNIAQCRNLGADLIEMGRSPRMVLGKHSGRQAVRQVYAERRCFALDLDQAEQVPPLVRRFVTETKRSPEAADLRRFLAEIGYPQPC